MAAVTADTLGAWVVRCNPRLTDPERLFADGVDNWCVARGYRSALMEPGQPVLLWITAARERAYPRGFWGRGQLTGPVSADDAGTLHAPMRMTLWRRPVPAAELAGVDGLADLEVLRQPQMANPSFVSAAQWRRLTPLLPN